MKPEQRVIIYRKGMPKLNYSDRGYAAAQEKGIAAGDMVRCPECGKGMLREKAKRQPHRYPPPNKFLRCPGSDLVLPGESC